MSKVDDVDIEIEQINEIRIMVDKVALEGIVTGLKDLLWKGNGNFVFRASNIEVKFILD